MVVSGIAINLANIKSAEEPRVSQGPVQFWLDSCANSHFFMISKMFIIKGEAEHWLTENAFNHPFFCRIVSK